MSGGHWEFVGFRIADGVETIAEDPDVKVRWPLVAAALAEVGSWVQRVEHEMDYDLSNDSAIGDDAAFDRAEFARLLDALLKAAPEDWFPRGKWATVQAVQGRAEKKPRKEIDA